MTDVGFLSSSTNASFAGVRGTAPRHASASFLRTSSRLLIVSLMNSSPIAPAMPAARPRPRPSSRFRNRLGLNGSVRHVGAVDDRHRRNTYAAGHADLLVALEQRVVERPVGVHLALEDRVLDAPAAKVQHRTLELRHARLERLFRRKRRTIIGKQAVASGPTTSAPAPWQSAAEARRSASEGWSSPDGPAS